MITSAVSRRYAQALLMIATEKKGLDQFEEELEGFQSSLMGNPQVKDFMDNPRILAKKKKEVLDSLINGKASPIVSNFLHLIIDKRREAFYMDIISDYKKYADEARNIIDAEVRSAVELTDKDFRGLQQNLSKATGKNVRLKSIIDTSIIGGITVKVGDTVMDGSVTKKLSLLKNKLQQLQLEGIEVKK
ncbi:MAG: F0F1 ATP synthase subunit delta [Clostridia bacterium]|nr:F0F1 ATP synthase subunit delta [Clostridia bacterium]MDD4048248.1 F0F1 ATP synthase subunit delta [Clostridia bacterium]